MLTGDLFSPPLLSVKEKLTADPDSEIATTSLRVSLMCPVGFYGFFLFVFLGKAFANSFSLYLTPA